MSSNQEKVEAFKDAISKDLPYAMLSELSQLKLNDNIPTIIKNLKYFCKHLDKVILAYDLGTCFNYSWHFIKDGKNPNDDFYDISNHCSSLFSVDGYCVPNDGSISCWKDVNKANRIQYIHWIIKQLKLAQALYLS